MKPLHHGNFGCREYKCVACQQPCKNAVTSALEQASLCFDCWRDGQWEVQEYVKELSFVRDYINGLSS